MQGSSSIDVAANGIILELETLILNEVKSERERQTPYDITYIWNLIYGRNEPFHRKENHREQACGCQGGGGRKWDGLRVWR